MIMNELTTTMEKYSLAKGYSDQLGQSIECFVDHLNLGLMDVEKRLYHDLAGLTYKELKVIYKIIDPDMLCFSIRMGYSFKTAIEMFCNYKKTRIDDELRDTILEKIKKLSEEWAMELAYRIYALSELKYFLESEVQNLN